LGPIYSCGFSVNRDFTIARQFFPMQDDWLSTLLAIGTFGISFLMRPPAVRLHSWSSTDRRGATGACEGGRRQGNDPGVSFSNQ
jgi:hypothetical protein